MNKRKEEFEKTLYEFLALRNQNKYDASENLNLLIKEQEYKLFLIWDEQILANIENNFVSRTQKTPKYKEITYVEPARLKMPDASFLRRMAIVSLKNERNRKIEDIDRADNALEGHYREKLRVGIQFLQDKLTSIELENEFHNQTLEEMTADYYSLSESVILEKTDKIEERKAKVISDIKYHEEIIEALYKLQNDLEDKSIIEIHSQVKKLMDEKGYLLIHSSEFDKDISAARSFITENYIQQVGIIQDLKSGLEELQTESETLKIKNNESDHKRKKIEIRVKELRENIGNHQTLKQEILKELNKKNDELTELKENFDKSPEIIKNKAALNKSRENIKEDYKKRIHDVEKISDEEFLAPYKNKYDYKEKVVRKTITEFDVKSYKENEWITTQLRKNKKDWDSAISQRRSIIEEKEINHLLHFTTVENMFSIIKHGAIFSVDYLKEKEIYHSISDANRFDNKTDYISLSVSFPNYRMFHQKRRVSNDDWVVLEINPRILLNQLSLFYEKNAAKSDMREKLFPSSNVEFRKMFIDYTDHRSENRLRENETTDPQAEILVKRKININYISRVLFQNDETKMKYNDQLKSKNIASVNESLFSTRRDWKA
ncbi:DarT ssDNA thymidine ADP-ribosyltransferase family protein [Gammaproteobacteria bacterium]|nr:DarT ssDNA thymidine ADP-ribosyltransferase family protein [Gammaproteobacteria bacterium]